MRGRSAQASQRTEARPGNSLAVHPREPPASASSAIIADKAVRHLTHALLSTLPEVAPSRNRDFVPACAETVDDRNCLWKETEKVRKTIGHGFSGMCADYPLKK